MRHWFIVFLPFVCVGALRIEKGLEGTEYSTEGLSDKQLGIIRWLWNLTYLDASGHGSWAGLPEQPRQVGQEDSARYPLAFAAYAVASASFEHTPAARSGPAKMLHNIFTRLNDYRVWAYWSMKRSCAQPWTAACKLLDKSMCDIAAKWYEKDPTCPDPLTRANVMLSGHVAQVGSLFEAFGDDRLSTEGWMLQHGNWSQRFTLPSLFKALGEQAVETQAMGGGITCEPGMVYPSCNSHVHSAYRLYDAVRHTREHENLTLAWKHFLANHTSPSTREWLFTVLMRDRNDGSLARSIRGCGSHDGWVLAWLSAWQGGEELEQRGTTNFLENKRWTFPKPGQAFFQDDCFAQTKHSQSSKSWLASSWLLAMAPTQPAAKQRAREVYRFFEEHAQIIPGGDGSHDQFYYLANGENTSMLTESIMVTSNALRGMVESATTLQDLYGSVERLTGPSIVVDWPRVLVRRALWAPDENILRFTILDAAEIAINLDSRSLDYVTLNGQVVPTQPCDQRVCVSCTGRGDNKFEAHFSTEQGTMDISTGPPTLV
eukprot:TRINITY_DN24800_c0_g3_i1.p1 TRINITY_DN24800_c0_g3~~TRINITY_DN24800_c0_g3_i1.p1  ORF type:complete len:544 (-),score=55.23 TRINITY_DN24800_c0_g3_i1:37-1668(-)